jgi:CheY-like chemotaxis protein
MRRILVVDDDAVISEVFAVMLRRADFEVDLAGDGVKGVEKWEQGNYDLVLMDVQMPRMDGLEATRAIREKEGLRGGHTPIVAITAYALQKDEEQCLASGMDAYVSKPVDFKKFFETIRRLIG